jgi:hypothetical protein
MNIAISDPHSQEGLVKKLLSVVLVTLIGLAPAFALAQAQAEEKILVGEVQSVDESGTEITLRDGTKLLTPPGAVVRPGALTEGMLVVAGYREEENGNKILTRLSRRPSEAAPAAPTESPKRF